MKFIKTKTKELITYSKENWRNLLPSLAFAICAVGFCIMCSNNIGGFPFVFVSIPGSFIGAFIIDRAYGLTRRLTENPIKWLPALISLVFSFTVVANAYFERMAFQTGTSVRSAAALFAGVFIFIVVYTLANILLNLFTKHKNKISKWDYIVFFGYLGFVFILLIVVSSLTTLFTPLGPYNDTPFGADGVWMMYGVFLSPTCTWGFVNTAFGFLATLPFAVLGSLMSYLFFMFPASIYMGMSMAVALIFVLIAFMMASMMKLSGLTKYLFIGIFLFAAPQLIFVLNIDLFPFAAFWFVLSAFLVVHRNKHSNISLAMSVKVPDPIFAIFAIGTSGIKKPSLRGKLGIIAYELALLCLWFAFFVFLTDKTSSASGSFFSLVTKGEMSHLDEWSGGTYSERFAVFTHMFSDFFTFPAWHMMTGVVEDWAPSGALIFTSSKNNINIFGVILMLLAILAFICCWRNRFAQICAFGMLFMFLLISVAGMGVYGGWDETFLYSTYFSWAFFGLIFLAANKLVTQLSQKFEKREKIFRRTFNTICFAILITLVILNSIELCRIIGVGMEHWQVS
jgi:hypothetical protein